MAMNRHKRFLYKDLGKWQRRSDRINRAQDAKRDRDHGIVSVDVWTEDRSFAVQRHDLALKILHEQPHLTMAEAERLAGLILSREG